MTGAPSGTAVTWWGHASTTIEMGGCRVATDPLLVRRLYHLRRESPEPPASAASADVVLVSHLHHDHLHLPSLDRFDPDVPVVVPRGASRVVSGLGRRRLVEVAAGERVEVGGVVVDVLPASHDGRRDHLHRAPVDVRALGFRVQRDDESFWFPGDTGVRADFADVDPVDLAVVPIGGWGPTLGDDHLDPVEAVDAASAVGTRCALAVHYGTFWPMALRRIKPGNHERLFVTPPQRFRQAGADRAPSLRLLTPAFGERVVLADVAPPGR